MLFEELTKGFRDHANRPIRDVYALTKEVQAEYNAIEQSWRIEEENGVPVVREPYIEKIEQGKGFREKKRYSIGEQDYALQLRLLENEDDSYMAEYPELFGANLTERSIHSKTAERFPDLDLDDPHDVMRHRLHVKMIHQQARLHKRDMILEKIKSLQTAKQEKGIKTDLADIVSNGMNAAQKTHLVLHSSEKPSAAEFHPAALRQY